MESQHTVNDIKDYIVVVQDVLSYEVCDALLHEYANSNEWQDTHIKNGIDKNIRSATTIQMSQDLCIAKNLDVRKRLDEQVFNGASKAITKYNEKFKHAHIEQDTGYELLRYKTGEFYTQHTDSFLGQPRAVSCSFALNDNYEGGEFAFFDREISVKAPKGAAVLFPSNFMYPHEILPVTKGTRYSIITWFR
jgi:predicted 2-oxoglutarate/Fe(II)-dependent dioxygenase YbiX